MLLHVLGARDVDLSVVDEQGQEHIMDMLAPVVFQADSVRKCISILNENCIVYLPETEEYWTTEQEASCLVQYVADYKQSEADMRQAAAELGVSIDEVRDYVSDYIGNDFDLHRHEVIDALARLRLAMPASK